MQRDNQQPEIEDEDPLFQLTIDWNAYWAEDRESDQNPDDSASVSEGKDKLVTRFIEQTEKPGRVAFVGCGPGILPASIAQAYPDTEVIGYDAAKSIIQENRREYGGISNLSFEVAVLPDFDVEPLFDLIYTYATLHYVENAEAAIEALYQNLRPGGYLICNYANDEVQGFYEKAAKEHIQERFEAVIKGKNILSCDQISLCLNAEVRDFWQFVDAEGDYVRSTNPCIFVEK